MGDVFVYVKVELRRGKEDVKDFLRVVMVLRYREDVVMNIDV